MPETLIQLHHSIMDADRIPFALAAMILVLVAGIITGPMAGNANPFWWIVYNRIFGKLGERIDKTSRPRGDLVFRGFLLSVLVLSVAFGLGVAADHFAAKSSWIEILAVSLCLGGGAVWYVVLALYFAVEKKTPAQSIYFSLSRSTRTDLNTTDDHGINREAIGYLGISFDKTMVAPVIWYLIGGLPALMLYTALSALVWRFGKCGFTKGFGAVPLALEKLMGYIPSLFAGFLFTAASTLTPTASAFQAFSQWWRARGQAPYEQGGFAVPALAWQLGITLGGAVQDISGSALQKSWVGADGATAKIDHTHIRRALYASVMAHFIFILALAAAYVFAGKAGW